MNENKKETSVTSNAIDSFLTDFKSNIESTFGSDSGNFNQIIMPEPIVAEDDTQDSQNISEPNNTTVERRVRFNPYK